MSKIQAFRERFGSVALAVPGLTRCLAGIVLLVLVNLHSALAGTTPLVDFSLRAPSPPPHDVLFKIKEMVNFPILQTATAPGVWDSIDVLNPSVIKLSKQFYNYYSGFDGKIWRTGLAASSDRLHWIKSDKNPIISPSTRGFDEAYIAANGGTIAIDGKIFHYYQGVGSDKLARIGVATSSDRSNFTKYENNPVLDVGPKGAWDYTGVSDPSVIRFAEHYYMFYLGQNSLGLQRLGIARSNDGVKWEKFIGNPILEVGAVGTFDENGLGEPEVIFSAPYFYMLYVGRSASEERNLGVAASVDGVHWRRLSTSGLVPAAMRQAWNSKVICDPSMVLLKDGQLMVFFGGVDRAEPAENLHGQIGLFYAQIAERDPQVFDVNADWTQIASTSMLIGSFPIEQDQGRKFAWVGPDSSISFWPRRPAKQVHIKGYIPFSIHAKRNGTTKITIEVSSNDHRLGQMEFDQDTLFDRTFDLDGVAPDKEGAVLITLHTDSVLAPTVIDKRELSFMLTWVSVE